MPLRPRGHRAVDGDAGADGIGRVDVGSIDRAVRENEEAVERTQMPLSSRLLRYLSVE